MLWDPLKYSRLILNNEMYLKLNILRTQVNTVHCTVHRHQIHTRLLSFSLHIPQVYGFYCIYQTKKKCTKLENKILI